MFKVNLNDNDSSNLDVLNTYTDGFQQTFSSPSK